MNFSFMKHCFQQDMITASFAFVVSEINDSNVIKLLKLFTYKKYQLSDKLHFLVEIKNTLLSKKVGSVPLRL